jgi:hypothetical protein
VPTHCYSTTTCTGTRSTIIYLLTYFLSRENRGISVVRHFLGKRITLWLPLNRSRSIIIIHKGQKSSEQIETVGWMLVLLFLFS